MTFLRQNLAIGCLLAALGASAQGATIIYDSNGFEPGPPFSTGNLPGQDGWEKWNVAANKAPSVGSIVTSGSGGSVVNTFVVFGEQAIGGGGATASLKPLSFSFDQVNGPATDLKTRVVVGNTDQDLANPTLVRDLGLLNFGLTTGKLYRNGGEWGLLKLSRQGMTSGARTVRAVQGFGSDATFTEVGSTEHQIDDVDALFSFSNAMVGNQSLDTLTTGFVEFEATYRYQPGVDNDLVRVLYRLGERELITDVTDPMNPSQVTLDYTYGAWNDLSVGVGAALPDANGFYPVVNNLGQPTDAPSSDLSFGIWWGQNANTGNTNAHRLDQVLVTSEIVSVIPEPGSLTLFTIGGVMGLAAMTRRRRK